MSALAAAETCNHGIYGEATTAALAKLLGDPSPQVRNAALRATASYANWRSPAGSAGPDPTGDGSEPRHGCPPRRRRRRSAQAVKLQAAGVPQDPPMFKALVSLLSEEKKNEPLHAAAFIALAPIRPYIIGGSGRRTISSGWRVGEVAGQDHD